MAGMQERLNKGGEAHIRGLAATCGRLWVLACEHDGVDPGSRFVIFSDANPAARLYNSALAQLGEARAQYAAGGYVGLRIEGGRAQLRRRGAARGVTL